MKKWILYSIFLFISFTSHGQNTITDSLENILLTAPLDTTRVDILNKLSYYYKYKKTERALLLSKEAEVLAKELNYNKGLASTYYCRAYIIQTTGQYQEAVGYVQQSIDIAQSIDDFSRQAYCNGLLGIIYGKWTNHKKALYHNMLARDLFKKIGDKLTLAAINTNIGTLYEERGVYDTALVYYFKSLEYKKTTGNDWATVTEYANIGAAYHMLEEYDLALEYNKKGIDLSIHSPNKPILDHLYTNCGKVFLDKNQLDSAQVYAQKAYKISKREKRPYLFLPLLKLLGNVNQQIGNIELATQYFTQGFELAHKIGNLDFQSSIGCELGKVYLEQNEKNKAIQVLLESYQTSTEIQNFVHLECTTRQLAIAYEGIENYQLALQFYAKNKSYQDSLNTLEKNKYLLELERKYKTEIQIKELAEKDLVLARKEAQLRNFIIGALLVLFVASSFFLFFRYQQKLKRQKTELDLQLEKAEAKKLRELGKVKSNFFANISHEFRTPLTLILGPLKQMQEGTFKGNTQKYQGIMIRNAERLMRLVNELLDLSKLENGKMKLNLENADILKTLKAMAFSFESLAERREIDFEINIPNRSITASYDKDKLEKILINLLSNAFKFTPKKGKISLDMKIVKDKKSLSEDLAIIQISDTGIGIASEQTPYIFERFFQTSNPSDIQASSGIGLALTKELVDLHKGKIEWQSVLNEGTSFILQIPIGKTIFDTNTIPNEIEKEKSRNNESLVPKVSSKEVAKLNEANPLLLVVEDNEDVRLYIKDQLKLDYQIIEAANGLEGIEMATSNVPDLIICDVMMPKMNGLEMCKSLKRNEKTSHIPIILLTAKAEREDKIQGLQTGVDDYLIKPFDAKELKIRIQNLIEQRQLLQKKFGQYFEFHPEAVNVNSFEQRFLLKIKTAIEENLDDEHFNVVELGKIVGMSRSQLHRKLKALSDQSPNQIIRGMRLLRAKELLEKKVGNSSEIAFMVGFNSLAYFSKCFRDRFGISPSEV